MTFQDVLEKAIKKNNSLLCVGLDSDSAKISKDLLDFNQGIIDSTGDLVCCYKINIAFYSAAGLDGLEALIKTIAYVHNRYRGIPVILDAKRADIGNTSQQYVKEVFDVLSSDGVTVNPYLGFDALEPFFKREEKGVFILCRTSNPGASDLQDTEVSVEEHLPGVPFYLLVARKVVELNKRYGNCFLVVGAGAQELGMIRSVAPQMFFLVPGIGVQGGDLKKTLKNGLRADKSGLIIHSARAIIYADNPREEAQKLRDEINAFRK